MRYRSCEVECFSRTLLPRWVRPALVCECYLRVSSRINTKSASSKGLALDKTVTDKAAGKDVKRPQLEAVQSFVREGDTVFCHSMDRLARNLDDLRRNVLGLTERGIHIVSLPIWIWSSMRCTRPARWAVRSVAHAASGSALSAMIRKR
jgi:hypothetical protein